MFERELAFHPGIGAKSLDGTIARAMESERADALIDDFLAEEFLRHGVAEGVLEPSLLTGQPLDPGPRNTSAPFIRSRHVGLRSWFGDRVINEAVADGVRQIVILAAGQDARAYRLIQEADCVLYEVDQPAVVAFNGRALAGMDAKPRCERRAVGADLAADWLTPLADQGWDSSRPTVWVIEGVLIYLPPSVRTTLFRQLTDASAPGSRISLDDAPLPELLRIQQVLRNSGVPTEEHVPGMFSLEQRDSSARELRSLGWTAEAITADELRARHGLPGEQPGNPIGELLGRCYVVAAQRKG
jgi:methyltransferase (TIGR00027 family)